MTPDDVCRISQNLARNCGYAVFPCSETKAPAIPGPGGYKHASKDPDQIERLWREHPGPLIGIATGKVSNLLVLDLDVEHDSARAWWLLHAGRLPPTRQYRSRSGGVHFHFTYSTSVGVSGGRGELRGVDVRGDGGYIISWFAAGFPCLDHSPPAPWPSWLLRAVSPPPPERPKVNANISTKNVDGAIAGIMRTVANAAEGERNNTLNWAAHTMKKRIDAGQIGRGEAESLLAAAADAAGIPKIEASRTIASGLKGVVAA